MAKLQINTSSPVAITALALRDSAGAVVPIVNLTLSVGTSSNAGFAALLVDSNNTTTVTFTPDGTGIVEFTFDTVNFGSLDIYTSANFTTSYGDELKTNRTWMNANGYRVGRTGSLVPITRWLSPEIIYGTSEVSNPSGKDISQYSVGTSTSLLKGTTRVVGGKTRYFFEDSEGVVFSNYNTVSTSTPPEQSLPNSIPSSYYTLATQFVSMTEQRELNSLANLYAQQAPVISNISVVSLDDDEDTIVVTADKDCQVAVYVVGQNPDGTERSFTLFTRDDNPNTKVHSYVVPKLTGYYRIVAIPTLNSYYRDFNEDSPESSVQGYAYSSDGSVQDGGSGGGSYDTGYKTAHEEIYSKASAYGWNFDFATRTDYAAVQTQFINTIADNQYIKAYKEIYDRGAAYGYTYNTASLSRSYYLSEQDQFLSVLTSSGAVESYKSIYDRGSVYGFTYDAAQTDKSYYLGREASFVSTIDSFSDARAYKRAYNEVFNSAKDYETLKGVPEGYTAWSDVTSGDGTKKDTLIRHVYNSGFVKAKQETFDRGLVYGYDFRDYITPGVKSITDATITSDYTNEGSNFFNTVTLESQKIGYVDIYNHVNGQYGFSYDSTNSANRTPTDYISYLSSQKVQMVSTINNNTKVSLYKEIFEVAATDFLFTFDNTQTNSTYYDGKVHDFFSSVYNYGTRTAYQRAYDRGENYNFNTTTDYLSLRDPNYTLRGLYNDSTTNVLDLLRDDFEIRLYEAGVIFTYKRFYDLGIPYGFVYNGTNILASYYDGKRQEFLDIFSGGNKSLGIKYVFDIANVRYGFTYTNSSNYTVMQNQVPGMFDFIDNKVGHTELKYVFDLVPSFPLVDDGTADTLREQVDDLLAFMVQDSVDIEEVEGPFLLPNYKVKFNVTLRRNAGLVGLVIDKETTTVLAHEVSFQTKIAHTFTFSLTEDDVYKNLQVVFLPTPRL